MATTPPTWVSLGRISGIFGVAGWIRVHSFTDPREAILRQPCWWIGSEERRERAVLSGRPQGAGIVASLAGVEDRESARGLIGAEIAVPRARLPRIEGYYQADLIGLEVENREGIVLGRIARFIATPVHDVIVVEDGVRERLIPFAPGVYVDKVVPVEGVVVVDWNPED